MTDVSNANVTRQEVTILLVDDNIVDISAVRRAFREQRIANPIIEARDGLEALEKLRARPPVVKPPYLILLDLNMPRMSGIEFLAELRDDARLRDSIVFVLTTSNSEEDKVESYGFNVAGYIVKSQVGERFINLINLLGNYWRIVEFPVVRGE